MNCLLSPKALKRGLSAAVLTVAAIGSSYASPLFTVNPSVFGLPAGGFPVGQNPFNADFISGSASALLTITSPTTISGSGYVQLLSFQTSPPNSPGISPISPFTSGLGVNYEMYVLFTYTTLLTSGSIGQAGSNYSVTSLNFQVFGDAFAVQGTPESTFTAADAATATAATVAQGPGTVLLGSGSLNASLPNGAAFNAGGGSSFNAGASFSLTPFGSTYFIAPVPFYNVAFDSFTNTVQGVSSNGNLISLNNANGGLDFGRIPEPSTLAIVGLGLLALGGMQSRKNRKV